MTISILTVGIGMSLFFTGIIYLFDQSLPTRMGFVKGEFIRVPFVDWCLIIAGLMVITISFLDNKVVMQK
jgi:hypothetical protein